jgi:hypothetical protein
MQTETWNIHVTDNSASIESREYVTQLHYVFGNHATRVIVFMQAFQPFVAN